MRLPISPFAPAVALAATLLIGVAGATTPSSAGTLEVRAAAAFNGGDYARALPMLRGLAGTLKDHPDRLGMVQEQIRVCEKNLAAPAATQPAATQPMAVSTRTPHSAPKAGETLDMDIRELGNFDIDDDQNPMIPPDVKALSGSTVRLRGFMVPIDSAEKVTRFVLVPSLTTCCNGGPPQMQHTVIVMCPKGKSVQFCSDQIIIEGKLTVDVIKDDDFVTGIFAVDVASVKPVPQ
jgi:hypothetical protein